MMTPHFTQEIARQRQVALMRQAESERLATRVAKDEGVVLSVGRRLRKLAFGRVLAPRTSIPRPA
jgi:hypothetical protein